MAYCCPICYGNLFAASVQGLVAIRTVLVPPNANRGPRFELEFLQDVLHVFLHGARTAPENFSDLAVAFAGGNPFDDFELAFAASLALTRGSTSAASCVEW